MKTTQTRRVQRAQRPADDKLMILPEIAEYIRREEETIRWWRKTRRKDAAPVWKQGGRLVAWKSELDAWLDAQQDADMEETTAS